MKDDTKNSKKLSKNSKKVIINTKEDLAKIPFSVLKSTDIYDFEGDFYKFIYDRALEIEKNPEEKKEFLSSNNYLINKNTSKKVVPLKEHSKTAKIIKTVKKSAKKSENSPKKKEETKIINNKNNFYEQDNYKIYSNNNNNDNEGYANQSLPLPKVKYNQEMSVHLLKKQLKIDYIVFQMKYNTRPGEDLGVIGSINELGMWDQNKALKLGWNEGNIWKTKINYSFSGSSVIEFKFIFISNGRVKQWEDGDNRKLVYEQLRGIIEPNIKEGYLMEFKNINGNNIIYNYKDCTLTVICDWNKK
jgi:hypothetical protein